MSKYKDLYKTDSRFQPELAGFQDSHTNFCVIKDFRKRGSAVWATAYLGPLLVSKSKESFKQASLIRGRLMLFGAGIRIQIQKKKQLQ